ncbi:MAG: hypothetical protein ACNS62_13430 [Candidatus Cyclobacteriaceae bacterium M3_2C_046]
MSCCLNIKNLLVFLVLVYLTSCSPATPSVRNWTTWDRYKDSPGLEYRAFCKGKVFKGSKFFKWEVEVRNLYHDPANFDIAIYDNFYNRATSESYRVKVIPGDIRKVIFYNVEIPGSSPFKIKISSVVL